MYINKNKALSFIEIIVAVTILLAVSFAGLITFYSINKSFLVIGRNRRLAEGTGVSNGKKRKVTLRSQNYIR